MSDGRATEVAVKFLQESVFAAREMQHGRGSLPAADAGCGLGEKPAMPGEFTERQARLLEELLSRRGSAAGTEVYGGVQRLTEAWIRVQDGLDRKRNHFLKAFRQEHGFDRRAYAPEVEAEFSAGLDAINRDNRVRLEEQAGAMARLVLGTGG